MLEQEIASAMKFILESAGNPAPYYYNVPQDFIFPAVYFPTPEISSAGDTLNSYSLSYSWHVKFFHKDTQSAHELAFAALAELLRGRNLVPLIDETGEHTGKGFRMKDPDLKIIDDGAVQLSLAWDSPRPYRRSETQYAMKFWMSYTKKHYDKAVEQIYELHETED